VSFDPSLPDAEVNVSRTHPVREALVLVSGVAGIAVALVVVVALAVEWAVPRIPPAVEARLFSTAWARDTLGSTVADVADPRSESASRLLDRLVRHWPECPLELRVAIWHEDTPNALAIPGGLILVTTGLLDQVGSENELGFVLAHEIGHFRNRDHLRGIGRGVAVALVLGALGLNGSGGVAQLATLSGGLAARGFDRRQEAAADRFALELVQAEYGHVAGAWDFFDRLPDPGSPAAKELSRYLASHPLNDARIAALRELARERGWPITGELVPLGDDWRAPAAPVSSTAPE